MSSTNLIPPLTSFIGRAKELAEITPLLARARLLTLTGAGGCGKTRLAMQLALDLAAAHSYPNGIWWVELAGLTDAALVPQAVAQIVGLREAPDTSSLADTLADYFAPRHILLALDNCEHLLPACAELALALLPICPHLHILTTSREPLGVAGEVSWLVPSLSLPDPRSLPPGKLVASPDLTQSDAIRLFIERATLVMPAFTLTPQNAEAVTQICKRLDGLPLAIELAAARVKVLTVGQIAARLDDRFTLLTGGNATALIPRHQTLRATMDWSHDLLSEPERILFRRLSVFAGGFTLEAAEAVGAGNGIQGKDVLDLLAHLVDKSLVLAETPAQGEARYRLLETVRQSASEKLQEAGEARQLHRHHRDWFLALAEQAEARLRGPEQMVWLDRLEAEHDNLRAALAGSLAEISPAEDPEEAALRLAGALFWFWNRRGYWSEGRRWLESVLEVRTERSSTAARAKALYAAGELAFLQGDHATAQRRYEQSVALWRSLVAQQERVESETGDDEKPLRLLQLKRCLALAMHGLGYAVFLRGDHPAGHSMVDESLRLCRSISARWEWGYALSLSAHMARVEGDYATARARLDECVTIFRETGDKWGLGLAIHWRGIVALIQADYPAARAGLEEALAIFRELGDKWNIANALNGLGELARSLGDDARALPLYEETLAIHRELGSKWGLCFSLHNLGYVVLHRGDSGQAAELFQEALSLNLERQDSIGTASCLAGLGGVAAASGDPQRGARLLGKSQALLGQIGAVLASADILEFERNIVVARAQLDAVTFEQAWEAGRALTLAQAIDEALRITSGQVQPAGPGAHAAALVEPLKERELEVLRLIAQGLSNHEIADRLIISLSTVKWHVNNLFGKLGVRSRTQAIARGKELGML